MTTYNRRAGLLAFAMQSAAGVPVDPANPPAGSTVWVVPINSGGLKAMRDRADLPITRPTSARAGQYIQRAWGGGTITILAHPDPLNTLFYSCTGTDSPSGGGPLYTHVHTLSETLGAKPLTMWTQVADHWEQFTDAYIQKMTLRGTSGENILVELDVISWLNSDIVAPTLSGSAAFLTALQADDPRFKYIGSTIKLEADSATPTTVTNVESAEITIDRTMELRYGSQLTPQLGVPVRNIDASFGLIYDSAQQGWDFYRVAKRGAAAAPSGGSGRPLTQNLASGSWEVTFGKHPSTYTGSLKVASNGANWDYDVERPDADPAGGPLELTVAGVVRDPGGGGSEITITLINNTALN